MSLLLTSALYVLMYLGGTYLYNIIGPNEILSVAVVLISFLPFIACLLDILSVRKNIKAKKKPFSTRRAHDSFEAYQKRICDNYKKESRRVLSKFTLVYTLYGAYLACMVFSLVFSMYYPGVNWVPLPILYDAVKRLMPRDIPSQYVRKSSKKDFPKLYAMTDACAKKMKVRKPSIVFANSDRVVYANGILSLGVRILPHLTKTQTESLICGAMYHSKLTAGKITRMTHISDGRRSLFAPITFLGGPLYSLLTDCSDFSRASVAAEEYIANKYIYRSYGEDYIDAMAKVNAYFEFSDAITDNGTLYDIYQDERSISAFNKRLKDAFDEYLDERSDRLRSILDSTVQPLFISAPRFASCIADIGVSKYSLSKPDDHEKLPELSDMMNIFDADGVDVQFEFEKRNFDSKYTSHHGNISAYERGSLTDPLSLSDLKSTANAYLSTGNFGKAKDLLAPYLDNENIKIKNAASLLYGEALLMEDDPDGIPYIANAAILDREFSFGYRVICDFAAKFGMDKVFEKYKELYFRASESRDVLITALDNLNESSVILPTLLDNDKIRRITSGTVKAGNGTVESIQLVRLRYSGAEETNLVYVKQKQIYEMHGGQIIENELSSALENISTYLASEDIPLELMSYRERPMVHVLLNKKVPDCTVYIKRN